MFIYSPHTEDAFGCSWTTIKRNTTTDT